MFTKRHLRAPFFHGGSIAIEFAFVLIIFMVLMFGVIDFSRWLFAFDSTIQATRHAARLSVVCDKTAAWESIKTKASVYMVTATGGELQQTWLPAGCTNATCLTVTIRAVDYTISPYSPYIPGPFPLPVAETTLVRESMESADNTGICN